jgi:hypothetical protein
MNTLRHLVCCAIVAAALTACGGGGGDAPASNELPVTLGQPGPGDPDAYLPLAQGNFWHFRGTSVAGGATTSFETSMQVTGTRTVGGVTALVLREAETTAGDGGEASDQSVVKDLNGLAVLEAGSDPLSQALTPYWELRFPLQSGDAFVQLDRSDVDMGEDLDGDGRNERVDVRSTVTLVGFETVSAPVGTFSETAHIRRQIAVKVRLSGDGRVFEASETADAWFARGIGWVRRSSTVAALGESITTDQLLDAYFVGGVAVGMQEATGPVHNGALGAEGTSFALWRNVPAGRTAVALAGLTGEADLRVLSASCTAGSGSPRAGVAPEECTFDANAGPVVVQVTGAAGTRYQLWQALVPSVSNPATESRAISSGIPTAGQVAARGDSTYSVTGLAPGSYTISIAGLSADADLKVYADDTYSTELDCTLRAPGDVLAEPEDCTIVSDGGVYFRVRSGEINTAGSSYLMLVHTAP